MNGSEYLDQEDVAEPKSLRVVPANSLIELDLCNVQESSGHGLYLAMMSLRSFAVTSPRR